MSYDQHSNPSPRIRGDAYGYFVECQHCHQRTYGNTIAQLLQRYERHTCPTCGWCGEPIWDCKACQGCGQHGSIIDGHCLICSPLQMASQATAADDQAPVMELGADLSPAVKALEQAYRLIQKRFKDAPNVTIVVQRDSKAWGHTTVAKVWAAAGSGADIPTADRFELMISGENLRRGPLAVAGTLLHEAAHCRNLANGILDTDTNGRHNVTFKTTAEAHGLSVEQAGWHGWTKTALTPEGEKTWAQLIKVITAGLAKSAASAIPTIDHLPKPEAPEGGEAAPTVTITPGGMVKPPKRGNRNLLKAVCGCGHAIRVSQGVLDAAQPTCQVCDEAFMAVGR